MKKAKAFSPGHITGFFEICRADDQLSTGSRGAGLCLSLGATTDVSIASSDRRSISVSINGRESGTAVTKDAMRRLIGNRQLHATVSTRLELPVSQGFGMSAAG